MASRQRLTWAQSFAAAIQGIRDVAQRERSFQVHIVATVLVAVTAIWLQVSVLQGAVLILCVGLVLTSELLNTAIENTVDLIAPEPHELARRAKDAAAGACLMASIVAVIIGLMILGPLLFRQITA